MSSSRGFAMEYDYDPLLDYCEDYAWDPSDSDLESEDQRSVWDLSDRDNVSLIPPQSCNTNYLDNTSKDTPSVSKCLPSNFSETLTQEISARQTIKDEGRAVSQPSKVCHGKVHRVPHVDRSIFQFKEIHGSNKEGSISSSIGFGSLICILFRKYYGVTKKAIRLGILKMMKWVYFKWLFIVLNVLIEVCQAAITQENAQGKISTSFYLKLSITSSLICLMISIFEMIHEGKVSKVVWRSKHGCFGWFYHPGRQRRLFGRFSLVFGVVSSVIQLCINLVALVINKAYLKFEMLPLLLSSGYLIAALIAAGKKIKLSKSKCKVRERRLGECSWCKLRLENESLGLSQLQLNSNIPYMIDESYDMVSNQFKPYADVLSIKIRCK